MRIAVTGASGLIGSALVPALRADGHEVQRFVRRESQAPDEISWDPKAGTVGPGLEGVDGVVHLAGAGVGDHRWTDAYKKEILDSRVLGTQTISQALAELADKPAVLVSGSAIGYYGDAGATPLTEEAPAGGGFLADVVRQWEAATKPASDAGIRVVHARTGLVMATGGGALAKLLPIFRSGAGGRIGSGDQYWSFISLRDEVRALQFALTQDDLQGAVNLTGPQAITNREATKVLAEFLHRPAVLPVPAFALKLALGEFANDILGSQNVVPSRLEATGFEWLDPKFAAALASAVGDTGEE